VRWAIKSPPPLPHFDDHKNNEKKMTITPVTPFFVLGPSLLPYRGRFPNNKKKPMIFKLQK
jgi:hypothetical protein